MSSIDESTRPNSSVSPLICAWNTRARSIHSALSSSSGVECAGSSCLSPRLALSGSGFCRHRGSSRGEYVAMFERPVLTGLGRRPAARSRIALVQRVADAEADRVAREVVVVVALLRGPAHGPARVLGDRVGRTDRDVGVDERAAADAGRAQDRHAVVVAQPEQPLAAERGQVVEAVLVALAPHAARVDVEEAAEVVRRRPGLHRLALALQERERLDVLVLDRRGLRRPPRAALEHQDPLAVAARLERARQAQRGHRAPEPRADHDGVVVLFRCLHHKPPDGPRRSSRPPTAAPGMVRRRRRGMCAIGRSAGGRCQPGRRTGLTQRVRLVEDAGAPTRPGRQLPPSRTSRSLRANASGWPA